MIIKNGLFLADDGQFHKGSMRITNGVIQEITDASIPSDSDEVIDATNCYIIPGLIDMHLHGAMGADLCDATENSVRTIAQYELQNGITSICPATMSFPLNKIYEIAGSVIKYNSSSPGNGAKIIGINMEGPFINPSRCGAQNKAHLSAPNLEGIGRLLSDTDNLIKIIDIAPELEGAMDFIKSLSGKIRISLAHTDADYDIAMEAFKAGANGLTHTGNAMPPILTRMPGPIAAASENENVTIELIADGIHVHPAMVRLLFKVFGRDRIIFVSDSMEACGLPDGDYSLGDQAVSVQNKKAVLTNDNSIIAGSVCNLMDCVRTAVTTMDIPLADAIVCASHTPAKALGIYEKTGSLAVGKTADIVILDNNLNILHVIHN